jgi:glycosyltransferase involved in cell wall biosynthesis
MAARKELGISTTNPVLFAAADNLDERRKGFHFLLHALRNLGGRKLTVLTMGTGRVPEAVENAHFISMGYVDSEPLKARLYNAADLMVHPAPQDNFPNTVLESLSCGTPVVAFNTGGMKELVRPGETGWLSEEISATGLSSMIEFALGEISKGQDLRGSCRSFAEKNFRDDLQVQRYEELFKALINRNEPSK